MTLERELWVLGMQCGCVGAVAAVWWWHCDQRAQLSSLPSAHASVVPGLGSPAAPGMSRTILLSPFSVVRIEFGA